MKGFGSTLTFGLLALALIVTADWAAAEPSPDQVAAIKANCRSDFMSKCWGVPRGGKEAMQCLKNNMASVSPGCQQALKALNPPAAAKPAAAPPPAAPAPAKTTAPAAEPKPETAATPPPSAPASEPAPASAPKAAAKTPAKDSAPAPAAKTPTEAKAKEPAAEEMPSAAAKPPVATPAPAEETTIIGFIPPRKKLMILRNCRQDLTTHCGDVSYGEGRQLQCLFSHKAALTTDCQGALAKLTN